MTTQIGFTQIQHVIDTRFNGQHESGGPDGKSGNITFIWADLQPNYQGQPYCAAGVSDIWRIAGHPFAAIDHTWGFSYTPDAEPWARKHGLWQPTGRALFQPGDTIIYDWAKNGHADHTGIVIQDHGNWIYTFECNTSAPSDTYGSQRNGGGNYYRQRNKDATVMGVLQSSKWLVAPGKTAPAKPAPKPTPHHVVANPYKCPALTQSRPVLQQGARMSAEDIKFVQWAVACTIDGVWGNQTTAAVKTFQKYKGLGVDGIVGPQTLSVMRRVTR